MFTIRHEHHFYYHDTHNSHDIILAELHIIKEQLINQNIKLNNMGEALNTVKQDLADLKQAVADERAEVSTKLDSLSAKIDDLTSQLANGASADDLAALSAEIKTDIEDIKSIVTPDAPAPTT